MKKILNKLFYLAFCITLPIIHYSYYYGGWYVIGARIGFSDKVPAHHFGFKPNSKDIKKARKENYQKSVNIRRFKFQEQTSRFSWFYVRAIIISGLIIYSTLS